MSHGSADTPTAGTVRLTENDTETKHEETVMKARMYRWGTTIATLAVLLEALGAGKKW